MSEAPWDAHVRYLEEELEKLRARVEKLESMAPGIGSAQKQREVRELAARLRIEVNERRNFLAVVKQK
jgi:hypothetical protein